MTSVGTVLIAKHDVHLILLSITIAILASYTALEAAARIRLSSGSVRYLWLVGSAFSLGLGIWSMHFIGMLAYQLPMVMNYDPMVVFVSLAIAIIASGVALSIASFGEMKLKQWLIGSLFMGVGVAAMHYSGMAAMRLDATPFYNLSWVALSVAIAFVACSIALWLAFRLPTQSTLTEILKKIGSAIVMGNAIAGMHYTAMAAVTFKSTSTSIAMPLSQAIDSSVLAVSVGIATVIILLLALIASQVDRRLSIELARLEERQRAAEALQVSEKRFRTLVANIPGAIYRCASDSHWTCEFISDVIEEISGYPASDFINNSVRTCASIIHPEDTNLVEKTVLLAIEKKEPYIIEYRIIRADNSWRWVYEKGQPVFDEQDNLVCLDGALFDITERKQNEVILQRYQLLSKQARDVVLFIDLQGRILEANHAAIKAYGYEPEELLRLKIEDLRMPQTHALLAEQMAQAETEGILFETQHRRQDNTTFPVEVSSQSAVIDNQTVLLSIIRDISQRKIIEQELKESSSAIRSLYKVTAARKLNFEQRVQGILAIGRKLFGLDMGALGRVEDGKYEVVAAQIPRNSSFNIKQGDVTELEQTYCQETIVTKKLVCFSSARTSIWCTHPAYTASKLEAYIGTPVIVRGKAYGTLSFFSSQPRQKSFTPREKEFIKLIAQWLGEELERLQAEAEIRKALAKEKELNELKSRFISITSHEFRNPLSIIFSLAQLLDRFNHKLSQEQKISHLHRIQKIVKSLLGLLDEVLLISKGEAGKLKFQPQNIDLNQFCFQLVEEIQLTFGEQHEIIFNYSGVKTEVFLDENIIRHIFTNLLTNAIKYSPNKGIIEFSVHCDQNQATFIVKDFGIGIPEDDLPKLFESFHRATNVGKIQGTGLGLSIVKRMVDLHSGSLNVDSQMDIGTTFTVILPLH